MSVEINVIHEKNVFDLLHQIPNDTFDLIICDGPYGVTQKSWDNIKDIQQYNLRLLRTFTPKMKSGATLYLFGKHDCLDFIDYRDYLKLQGRIVWHQPSRLSQGKYNYTNSYDIICFFTKGDRPSCFDLDAIRVPQLVSKEFQERIKSVPSVVDGTFSEIPYNPKGKNPGNVWPDIKALTYHSKELVSREVLNTIQKPEALFRRLVKASSKPEDLVFDPFSGTGTCPVVCKELNRNFLGCEIDPEILELANKRLASIAGSQMSLGL